MTVHLDPHLLQVETNCFYIGEVDTHKSSPDMSSISNILALFKKLRAVQRAYEAEEQLLCDYYTGSISRSLCCRFIQHFMTTNSVGGGFLVYMSVTMFMS